MGSIAVVVVVVLVIMVKIYLEGSDYYVFKSEKKKTTPNTTAQPDGYAAG